MSNRKRPSKKGRKQITVDLRNRRNLRQFGHLSDPAIVYRRVMSYTDQSISTTAGGIVASTALISSAAATSAADWASCANLYQSYRVVRLKVKWFPAYRVNTTAVTVPAMMFVVPYYGNQPPTTIAGFCDSSGLVMTSGYSEGSATADFLTMNLDGDSHLWTPTSSAITASEQFGIQVMGTATASTVSTLVWKYTAWLEVEFKMAG